MVIYKIQSIIQNNTFVMSSIVVYVRNEMKRFCCDGKINKEVNNMIYSSYTTNDMSYNYI